MTIEEINLYLDPALILFMMLVLTLIATWLLADGDNMR